MSKDRFLLSVPGPSHWSPGQRARLKKGMAICWVSGVDMCNSLCVDTFDRLEGDNIVLESGGSIPLTWVDPQVLSGRVTFLNESPWHYPTIWDKIRDIPSTLRDVYKFW